MNAPGLASTSSPQETPPRAPAGRGHGDPNGRAAADFSRALRDKAAVLNDERVGRQAAANASHDLEAASPGSASALRLGGHRNGPRLGDAEAPTPDSTTAGLPPAFLAAPLPARDPAAVPPAVCGAIEDATGPRAAIEAALTANAGAPVGTGRAETPGAWTASVRESTGTTVEMHITRADNTLAAQPGVTWSLAVASSALGPDALARHAHLLAERLRERTVGVAHVRIARSLDESGDEGDGDDGDDQ